MRPHKRTGGLQRKFFFALLTVGTVPGIVALWATYHFSTASVKEAIGEGVEEIARSTALRLATAIDHEIDRAVRLALVPAHIRQPVIRSNARVRSNDGATASDPPAGRFQTDSAETGRYLREWAGESSHYVRILVVDRQGNVIASTEDGAADRHNDQLWWRETMQAPARTYYVGPLTSDAPGGEPVFHIGVPILDDSHRTPIGAVGLVIRREFLTAMILPIRVGDTGHGMLMDTQGTPLICPVLPPTAHLIPQSLMIRLAGTQPLWLVAEDDAHGGHDAIVGAAPVEISHAITRSSLGAERWYAFIRQAPEESYAPVYALLTTVGLIGFGLVVVLSSFGFVVGHRIVQPLTALQREAEALRQQLTLSPSGLPAEQSNSAALDYRTGDEIEDLAESFVAMRGVLEDNFRTISAQQRELVQREKLASVGQLLAALAHDIRNPLGVMRSSAQLIFDGNEEQGVRQEVARYIIDEIDKLSHRLNDFLRYARQKPPDYRLVSAEDIVRSALWQWEAQGGIQGIQIDCRFADALPPVRTDPEQIKEALINLLHNAREAMPQGGDLTLRTSRDGPANVAIEVIDSGTGIQPEHLSRIFEPFFTTKEYGTGLGLTNVKRLVEENGGSLAIRSTVGAGTTVTVRLSAASADQPDRQA
ncbi:MAG TPA: ATP-binding protein [Nitrospiraceae bacterium]|nr:ATP-binding protein [Nitrospiraceae bacterium]